MPHNFFYNIIFGFKLAPIIIEMALCLKVSRRIHYFCAISFISFPNGGSKVTLLFSLNSSYLDLQEAVSGFKLAQIIIEIEKFLLQSIPTPPPFVQDVSFASERTRATQFFLLNDSELGLQDTVSGFKIVEVKSKIEIHIF
jgi:hypothetical protein